MLNDSKVKLRELAHKDVFWQCVQYHMGYFGYEEALRAMGAAFAQSGPKMNSCYDFPKKFGNVYEKFKGVFESIHNHGWNMDPFLHTRVKTMGFFG